EFVPLPVTVGFEAADEASSDGPNCRCAAGNDAWDSRVLLDLPRCLGHFLQCRRHLDVVLVEDVFAVSQDVTLLEHGDGVERALADAPAGLAVPAVGSNERRVEVIELEPLAIGQFWI